MKEKIKLPTWGIILIAIWIVILVIILPIGIIGTALENKKSSDNNDSKTPNKTVKETITKDEIYKWECTKDIVHEGIEETQVLEVGKDINIGKYKAIYTYTSYYSKQTTNRFNRQYFIYISNLRLDDVNGSNINKLDGNIIKSCHFYPENEDPCEFEVVDGNYIYIHHPAIKEAGNGTLKFESA